MSSRLRRSTRFALTPAERALIDEKSHTPTTSKKDKTPQKRSASNESKGSSSKKDKEKAKHWKTKEKEKTEKERDKEKEMKKKKRGISESVMEESHQEAVPVQKRKRSSGEGIHSPGVGKRSATVGNVNMAGPSIVKEPLENMQQQQQMPISEALPSIYDQEAIEAFFKKNKKRTFRDLLGESLDREQDSTHLIAGAQSLMKDPSTVTSSDSIKQIIGGANREMSVKEALALNFRNYRVRMPRQRFDSMVTNSIFSAASLLEPNYGRDEIASGQDPSGTNTPQQRMNLQEMITVMQEMSSNQPNFLNLEGGDDSSEATFNLDEFLKSIPFPGKSSKTIAEMLIEMNFREDMFDPPAQPLPPPEPEPSTPSFLISNGHKGYPFMPFWKLPVNVSRGYRNVYYVQGVKYVQLNTIMYQDAIIVPMNEPISFRFNEYLFDLSLNDLLLANGIFIRDHTSCRDMLAFLNSCGFAVHHELSEYLMNTYGPNISADGIHAKKELLPIPLSPEFPPFVCHKLEYFTLGFGRNYGVNEIVDVVQQLESVPSKSQQAPSSQAPPPPLAATPGNQPLLQDNQGSQGENEEENVRNLRRNTVIIAALNSGQRPETVSERFGITLEEVQEIAKTREEVARQLSEHYTSQAPQQESSMRAHDLNAGDLMQLKKKTHKIGIRRTSYVGLNVMMWRFFKDCRDNGICLNGKLLKEQAMLYAKQLGLENFKGSEGWLDAFKRRHKIDLKQMSGVPVNYEEDKIEYDEENDANRPSSSSGDSMEISLDHVKASNEGLTAALLECVEKASATSTPTAMANISNSKPLDLAQFFNDMLEASTSSANTNPLLTPAAAAAAAALTVAAGLPTSTTSAGQQTSFTPISTPSLPLPSTGRAAKQANHAATSLHAVTSQPVHQHQFSGKQASSQAQLHSSQPTTGLDERSLIASVVKSAAVRVPDRDVSYALDTLRSFVLNNDPSLMPMLLDLQIKLATLPNSGSKKTTTTPNGRVHEESSELVNGVDK